MKKSLINILALMILSLHLMAAVSVDVNGTNYTIPETGEQGWGENVTMWIQGISANTIHPDGGDFNLTDELSFGSSYGLKSLYYKSDSSDPASSGEFRLANSDTITFRNNANDDDLELGLSTDTLQFNSIDLVDLSTTQSLSNKTLTSPVINTGVSGSAVLDDDSMSTVSATTLATSESIKAYVDAQTEASVTLTNKTLDAPVIDNALVITEEASSPSNPSSGFKKLYPKTNGRLYTLDSAGNELEVGSGGESGSKNYIDSDSADLEVGIGSWTTDDGAGSAAVYLTLSQETSVQLAGDGSLKLVKSANDASSEYIKLTTQAIDLTDRGKALFGSFSFDATHASYASSDFLVEIYDNTNSAVLYSGVAEDLEILKTKGRFNFVTYTESTTAEIEVRLKVNSTNASAYDLYFDEFKLGPAASVQTVYRKSQTINLTSSGDFTAGEIQVERVGNIVNVTLVTDATYSSTTQANSAAGLIPEWARPASNVYGLSYFTGTGIYEVHVNSDGSYNIETRNYSGGGLGSTTSADLTISYTVPAVTGPTLNDNELSLQGLKIRGSGNGATAITLNTTPLDFTEVTDSHSAWGSNNTFTAPKTGRYRILGNVRYSGSVTGLLYAYINGSAIDAIGTMNGQTNAPFAWEGELTKGQTWQIRGPGGTLSSTYHWISVSAVNDLTVLGAVRNNEVVESNSGGLVTYTITANQFGDLTSILLTEGQWDINAHFLFNNNGTVTAEFAQVGVSTTSGNSGTGLVLGDTSTAVEIAASNGAYVAVSNPPMTVNVTTPTTYYLKSFRSTSITNQRIAYKIHARRTR